MEISAFIVVVVSGVLFWTVWEKANKRSAKKDSKKALSPVGKRLFYSRVYLLTECERAFAQVLQSVVPSKHRISFKPRLADVVSCSESDFRQHGYQIASKHLDFVVTDSSSKLLCAIELDDASHLSESSRQADEFKDEVLASCGIPLIRVRAARQYDKRTLYRLMKPYL